MPVNRNIVASMMIAGGLAGLAGVVQYMGNATVMQIGVMPAQGFDGIAVALLGNNSPFGVLLSALFFGVLYVGKGFMNANVKVPPELADTIIATIIYFAATSVVMDKVIKSIKKKREDKKLGTSGQYLTKMAADNDALIAINGGGFNDPNFNSTGGSPLGITVSGGEYVKYESYSGPGGIIGFTDDDKLYLGKCSVQEAKSMGIRDAVTFGPFLIVNGKSIEYNSSVGGYSRAARVAIGQRKDGIVLMLVVDGRRVDSIGAGMKDLAEIMVKYGAYNAANLDGGASSTMSIEGKLWNKPSAGGEYGGRTVSNAWIVTNKQGKAAQLPDKDNYK